MESELLVELDHFSTSAIVKYGAPLDFAFKVDFPGL